MTKMTQLSETQDRPREKLARLGAHALSDQELIAILLGSGVKGIDVLTLATRVIQEIDRENLSIDVTTLSTIKGIGSAKACQIIAALEFSRRRIVQEGTRITDPSDVIPLIRHLADRKQETFICISLNGAHEVIATRIVTVGLVNLCQVHPREVFADALTDRACAVIVAHNHPSGNLMPSTEDISVTQRLKEAARILGISFLDHIIFSRKGHYSIGG